MTTEPPIERLINVMAALRHKETGCAWDREQDFSTIAPYTIEEAYEVRAAVQSGDPAQLKDELGDLLFQVVYQARLAEERGWFGFSDVAAGAATKMVGRHPHVFSGADQRDAAAQLEAWEVQKAQDRAARHETGVLDGIATGLPAMLLAEKLSKRAARAGFDWPDAGAVVEKLREETAELQAELDAGAPNSRLEDELGDLFFVLVNLARTLRLSPEACLDAANAKFARRFRHMEAALAAAGRTPQDAAMAELDRLWHAAKSLETKA